MLNNRWTQNSEPILFIANSYKQAEELCELHNPMYPKEEIRFLSSQVQYSSLTLIDLTK